VSLPALTPNAWLRYDVIRRILDDLEGVESVLEMGAGGGAMAARLAGRYRYVGLEPDGASFAKARERLAGIPGARILNADAAALERGELFDLVCAFEVLEHIEDDAGALRSWRERLRAGGWLLLSVPAFPARWAAGDSKVGHYRRYEPEELADLLRRTRYVDPLVLVYGFPLGYALEAARNFLARREEGQASLTAGTTASGRWLQPPDSLGWATRLGTAPFRLLQRPFARTRRGTGLVALARRAA
jgi:SAM-dependent methyltransferase